MISKIRLTLGLVLMVIVMTSLVVFIGIDSKQYKYYIGVPNRRDYKTNNYTSKDGCITFKNQYDNTVTLCGNYSIIERK